MSNDNTEDDDGQKLTFSTDSGKNNPYAVVAEKIETREASDKEGWVVTTDPKSTVNGWEVACKVVSPGKGGENYVRVTDPLGFWSVEAVEGGETVPDPCEAARRAARDNEPGSDPVTDLPRDDDDEESDSPISGDGPLGIAWWVWIVLVLIILLLLLSGGGD